MNFLEQKLVTDADLLNVLTSQSQQAQIFAFDKVIQGKGGCAKLYNMTIRPKIEQTPSLSVIMFGPNRKPVLLNKKQDNLALLCC